MIHKSYDCLVVGAGPAGLNAAIEVAKYGGSVLVVDENDQAGGQLYKQIHKFFGSKEHYAGTRGFRIAQILLEEAKQYGVCIQLDTLCWGIDKNKKVALKHNHKTTFIEAKTIVIATGASEKSISFDGCNIPGVITAGAAQTMVNIHRVKPGTRALIVGSGNVGLIVGYQLMQAGIKVVGLVEVQEKITGYDVHKNKLLRAGVPIYLEHTVIKAIGETVEGAVLQDINQLLPPFRIDADMICLAVGLKPRIDLLEVLNVPLKQEHLFGGAVPIHSFEMEVTNGIFVAGDASGVEEASTALEEGRLAGFGVVSYLNLSENTYKAKQESIKRLDSIRSGTYEVRKIAKQNQINQTVRM